MCHNRDLIIMCCVFARLCVFLCGWDVPKNWVWKRKKRSMQMQKMWWCCSISFSVGPKNEEIEACKLCWCSIAVVFRGWWLLLLFRKRGFMLFMLMMLLSVGIICALYIMLAHISNTSRERRGKWRENEKKIGIVNSAFSSWTVLAYFYGLW